MTSPINRAKLLVDQISGHVVWMVYHTEYNVPIFDSSLNYLYFRGTIVSGTWDTYLNFNLKFDTNTKKLIKSVIDNESELSRLKLLRLKAEYINFIDNRIKATYEKHGALASTKFYNNLQSCPDFWIDFFTEKYKCSRQSAIKLLNFKIEEYKILESRLEFIRYNFTERISLSKTIQEVEDSHRDAMTSLAVAGINEKDI